MELHVILVREPVDGSIWSTEAWDEYTIDDNPTGFRDAVEKAKKQNGADNVRIMVVDVPDDCMENAFALTRVSGTIKEGS